MQYLVQDKLHKILHGIRYLAMTKVIVREVAEIFFKQSQLFYSLQGMIHRKLSCRKMLGKLHEALHHGTAALGAIKFYTSITAYF